MTGFAPNTEGVFHDLPAADYHTAPGCSHSMLKNIVPTPAHLQAYLTEPREVTTAMILGTLVHSRILEPKAPLPFIAIPPAFYPAPADCSAVKQKKAQPGDPQIWSWSANYCKAWKQNHVKAGNIILTESENETLEGCINSVAKHPVCQDLFSEGRSEISLFKNFHYGGEVLRKARIDFSPKGNCLADIKTCQDASPFEFAKTIYDNGYHTQAAYYLDIWNDSFPDEQKEFFIFVAVEKRPPYLVAVYRLHREALGKGRTKNLERLALYAECAAKNHWPGYPPEVKAINLPTWAYKQPE